MRGLLTMAGLVCVAGVVLAQERIPPEIAQKYGRLVADEAAKEKNLQLKFEVNPESAFGLKHEEVGALVLPDKKLSEEVLKKTAKKVTPLGQLWVRSLTVVVKDQPIPKDQLRIVTVNADGQDHALPLFLLGVRRKAGDDLELVVYGPGKEPLMVSPLQKVTVHQDLPLEMEGKKGDIEGRGTLTLNILGKFQAQLDVAKQE